MSIKALKKHEVQNKSDYYSRLQTLLGPSDKPVKKKRHFEVGPIHSNDNFYEILNSNIKMTEVVHPNELKTKIKQLIDEYQNISLLSQYGIKNDNTILFYGPSGCGKTLTALAFAETLKKKLYLVNLSTIINSSLGKTSSNIFQIVEDAKEEHAIIFFDEFDALAKFRNDENDHGEMKRVTSSLLQMMDFLDERVLLIAATNHIDLVDKAILRRFKKKLAFDLPNKKYIQSYLKRLLKISELTYSSTVLSGLSLRYEGLSYAEIRDEFFASFKKYLLMKHKSSKKRVSSLSDDFLKI